MVVPSEKQWWCPDAHPYRSLSCWLHEIFVRHLSLNSSHCGFCIMLLEGEVGEVSKAYTRTSEKTCGSGKCDFPPLTPCDTTYGHCSGVHQPTPNNLNTGTYCLQPVYPTSLAVARAGGQVMLIHVFGAGNPQS